MRIAFKSPLLSLVVASTLGFAGVAGVAGSDFVFIFHGILFVVLLVNVCQDELALRGQDRLDFNVS